jgi:hypothetical protein
VKDEQQGNYTTVYSMTISLHYRSKCPWPLTTEASDRLCFWACQLDPAITGGRLGIYPMTRPVDQCLTPNLLPRICFHAVDCVTEVWAAPLMERP